MFFKRRNKDKAALADDAPDAGKKDAGSASGGADAQSASVGLSADALRRAVDPEALGFKTTADLDALEGPIGQDRAIAALDFGLRMRAPDFNVFVIGPPGAGKRTAVRVQLAKSAQSASTPPDWVYVRNFEDPRRPRAIKLPAGRAGALANGVSAALDELRVTLPAAFRAADYETRCRAIEEEFQGSHHDALEAIHAKAAEQNIAVLRTPLGFGMAPMHDGKVVKPDVFNQLPEAMRRDVESRIGVLQDALETLLANAPQADKERRRQLAALDEETAQHVIDAALDEVSKAFSDLPDVAAFLADLERDLIANVALMLKDGADSVQDSALGRYLVNVVVSRKKDSGAPVTQEIHPTRSRLLGSIAANGHAGAIHADAGLLHEANGGTLLLDAAEVKSSPGAWDALKRALRSRELRSDTLETTSSLAPEAIPLDVKVVLFGTRALYDTLVRDDPDVARLFKVQVAFEDTISRTSDTEKRYARVIASMVERNGLKPIAAGGVARLIEEASRIASDRERLTLDMGPVADIVREADFWSRHAGRDVTTADDVTRAISERARRRDGLSVRTFDLQPLGGESDAADTAKPGQAIALGVVACGAHVFAAPARITARVRAGYGNTGAIARDGASDTRFDATLWDYLSHTFSREAPLELEATLRADSLPSASREFGATLAELLALLSALADFPLKQDLGVIGGVNAWGETLAASHVNEQIEAFFDAVNGSEAKGTPGVIIPDANRRNLMLRDDVVAAVRSGRFSVSAVKTVDAAITLLMGREAGTRGADGQFGADTVNGRIAKTLAGFAERARHVRATKDNPASAAEKRA